MDPFQVADKGILVVNLKNVTVKQEIIDSEYNVAVGNGNFNDEKSTLLDIGDIRGVNDKVYQVEKSTPENDKMHRDYSEFDRVAVSEKVKLKEETVDKSESATQSNLKQKIEIVEGIGEVKHEIVIQKEQKLEKIVVKIEVVPPVMSHVEIPIIDSKIEDNECLEERLEQSISKYDDNEDQAEGLSSVPMVTDQNDCMQVKKDVTERGEGELSRDSTSNTEKEHDSSLEKKVYMCKICEKTFIKKSSLRGHKITHTGETPFKCQFCNKGFNVRSNLTVHLRIHTGLRPHECDICQKTFRQAGQLKTHERIHKGEKPYTCSLCSHSFRNSSALITHQRTHTGERPFPCDLCFRSFSTSTSLKTHRITHSGTMLYDCPVCGRQFNRKNNLNVHIKRHNKNRKFSCPKCSNGFVMRAHLLGHLKRAHKVDIQSDQINTFLDTCEDTAAEHAVKNELGSDVKNETELENESAKNINHFQNVTGTKDEIGKEDIEVKWDIDNC